MVRCPRCGSRHVSGSGSNWQCDMCKCSFTSSNSLNFGGMDEIDAELERIERRRKERLEKEKVERERLERERAIKERFEKEMRERARKERERLERERARKKRERKEKEMRERARKERERLEKERLERERKEKERKLRQEQEKKGIFVDKNLLLLKRCDLKTLKIVYEKINMPEMDHYYDKLNYVATEYSTKDIKRMIKEAEDQFNMEEKLKKENLERLEKERKEKERIEKERKIKLEREQYEESVSLLEEYHDNVLDVLASENNIDDTDRETRIDILAQKFNPSSLEAEIAKAEEEVRNNNKKALLTILIIILIIFVFALLGLNAV